jgi:hypothetical protein
VAEFVEVGDSGLTVRADDIPDPRRRVLLLLASLDQADPTFALDVRARLLATEWEERGVLRALIGG